MTAVRNTTELFVCKENAVPVGAGVTALLPDGTQVAIFRPTPQEWYALDNIDPISGAAVLSRGILGDRQGVSVVISPMLKHAFALATGECLDLPGTSVPTYSVRTAEGKVLLELGK